MRSFPIYCFFLVVAPQLLLATQADFYWRDFNITDGTIPDDAILAGKNEKDENIFIGQIYIKNGGLFTAQITKGAKEVVVPFYGPRRVIDHIKILCGHQEDFFWIPTNSSNLRQDIEDKQVIVGGHDDSHGAIYIGRIQLEGYDQVGKINSFDSADPNFHYINSNNFETFEEEYEVLTYIKQHKQQEVGDAADTKRSNLENLGLLLELFRVFIENGVINNDYISVESEDESEEE